MARHNATAPSTTPAAAPQSSVLRRQPTSCQTASITEILFGSVTAELTVKALLHPLDTLKTRLQYLVLPKRSTSRSSRLPIVADIKLGLKILIASTRSPHNSFIEPGPQTVRSLYTADRVRAGLFSLYRGIGVQLIGVVPIALVYMPTYELSSAAVSGLSGTLSLPLPASQLASLCTGCACALSC